MITLDGSSGEGGGQIVRTALALSLVTGTPVRLTKIRAGREKPGLRRQHLSAVKAAGEIGRADVDGVKLGSGELTFKPRGVHPGEYRFDIAGSGSTTLVLQTVLPALLTASGPSALTVEGGTHNPFAPPFEFFAKSWLPLVERMGPKIVAKLDRPGFYPVGEGKIRVAVSPVAKLAPFELRERGQITKRRARATVSELATHIVERELKVVQRNLGWSKSELRAGDASGARGPGNVLMLEVECEHVTEVFTGFGAKGVRAERVAESACAEAKAWLDAGVPVGPHLADQLLLPLALAGGGAYRTMRPLTAHTTTQIELLKRFLGVVVNVTEGGDHAAVIEIRT